MIPATRDPVNVEIDRLWWHMVTAGTPETKALWGERFTQAVKRRNAARTPEQIAELEREKGLRG